MRQFPCALVQTGSIPFVYTLDAQTSALSPAPLTTATSQTASTPQRVLTPSRAALCVAVGQLDPEEIPVGHEVNLSKRC